MIPIQFYEKYNQVEARSEVWVKVFVDSNSQPVLSWPHFRHAIETESLGEGEDRSSIEEKLAAYDRLYDQWTHAHSDDLMVEGVPLKEWPVINKAQYNAFVTANILSVEQLRDTRDSVLEKLGPGFKGLKAMAAKWLEEADKARDLQRLEDMEGHLETALKDKDEEIAALKLQIAAQAQAVPAPGAEKPAK